MKYIIANWKENGTINLCEKFIKKINTMNFQKKFVLCPPYVFFNKFEEINNKNFCLGAQNCSEKKCGSFTGEISCKMLSEMNIEFVIIGHSERRKFFVENNQIIKEKLLRAKENNLTPILCVGENIEKELKILNNIDFDVIIAYEPVWAVGSGLSESVENCIEMKKRIKEILNKDIKFFYGGSIDLTTYEKYLNCEDIDGILVGKASLNETILEMAK